ncbi:MAG: glycosyl hydrolase 53 family protein [Candidatus Hadarchaeales archaeon]
MPNPANSPNSTFEDLVEAYEETGKIAEVGMVWVENQGIGEFELLKRNGVVTALRVYGLKPFLTLSFAKVRVGPSGLEYRVEAPPGITPSLSDSGFREAWVEEARRIAEEFKPEYFSLGNEVNDYFYLHPEDLDPYLSLLEEAYAAVKQVSSGTKVLVVLSYDHLLQNQQWGLLRELSSRVDVIGLTTYPYKTFTSPDALPQDYYSRAEQYTSKPIAFTEIGWSSSENSENLQANFLVRFLELTKDMNLEMVNWLFLHETTVGGLLGHLSDPEIGTVALKRTDGSEKEVYRVWVELKKLKFRR